MAQTIQFRRDTAANWILANPTLSLGEPGFETDTRKIKIGDGTSTWTNLQYLTDSIINGTVGLPGYVGSCGAIGPSGLPGPVGEPGYTGSRGASGDPGPAGPQGPSGTPGPAGPQGPSGTPGSGSSRMGLPGARGYTGSSGTSSSNLISYSPANSGHWSGAEPTDIKSAIDRLAAKIYAMTSQPIP
jgi:hypothetical protein